MTHSTLRFAHVALATLVTLAVIPRAATAQSGPYRAVSVDLAGAHQQRYGVDYETCAEHEFEPEGDLHIGCSLTYGGTISSGMTTGSSRPERYVDADVFARIFLGTRRFHGWSIDVGTGLTVVPEHGPRPSLHAGLNRSWRVGPHLYAITGAGVRGVLGMPDGIRAGTNPTLRANLGVAF